MKKLLLLFTLSILITPAFAQDTITGGEVSGTWTKSASPYRIQGDITVPAEQVLTIEPGVIVDFDGHYKLTVLGQLFAEGAAGDTIRFTRVSNDPAMDPDTLSLADTSNTDGSWEGIRFQMTYKDSSLMKYCIVEFVETVDNYPIGGANSIFSPVDIESNNIVLLEHSVIRSNFSSIATIMTEGQLELDDCLISRNIAYKVNSWGSSPTMAGAVKVFRGYNSRITNNTITENQIFNAGGSGGIDVYGTHNLLIRNNFIANNRSNQWAISGGAIMLASSYPLIIQNLIVNNNCGHAAAIYYKSSGGKLLYNTIYNNKSTSDKSGALVFTGSNGTIAYNNLIYNNLSDAIKSQILIDEEASLPDFKYNLIGDDYSEITGSYGGIIKEAENYFGDPSLFKATTVIGYGESSLPGDWKLTEASFIINKGDGNYNEEYEILTDFGGYKRINYGDPDVGCHEYRLGSYTPPQFINAPEIWIADTIYINQLTFSLAKVTIYPDVVVCFDSNYEWHVQDSLFVLGNEMAPVFFTVDDTLHFSDETIAEGGWGPISMYGNAPKVFKYCIFEYGKYLSPSTHSLLNTEGNTLFENCTIRNCLCVDGFLMSMRGADITLRSNLIENNRFVTDTYSSMGMIYSYSASNISLINNRIFNNHSDLNLMALGAVNLDMINNSIYNNDGGLKFDGSNYRFINNTIVNNKGNLGFNSGDNFQVLNSIMVVNSGNLQYVNYTVKSSYLSNNVSCEFCSDRLEEEPLFANPLSYSGTGPIQEVEEADYSLIGISPGIDFGSTDTTGLDLMETDINGDPRINNDRIDIGAYENQEGLPAISENPQGGIFCEGQSHILTVAYTNSDTVLYQWRKYGEDIPYANNDSLVLNSLSAGDEGNYDCIITNSYGSVNSLSSFIKVNSPPVILGQTSDLWCEPGKTVSLQLYYNGTSPLDFQWKRDNEELPGVSLPEYTLTPTDSTDEGLYSCIVSNDCGSDSTESIGLFLAPQICMVTVSSTTGHNLVVWEKKSKAPIMAYNIYRESVAAGIYDRLTTIAYDDLSVFVDTTADPTVQAYIYKITAIDTAENETDIDLCKPHKTVHLIVSTNPELNTTQLQWDRYYGFDYSTYTIYKSTTGANFDPVHSLSASNNSWTDPNASDGDLFYRIAVEKPDPCQAEGGSKKAGTGPYRHSLSNMDNNKLKAGENPPDSIILDNHSIDEGLLPGSLVGRLITVDVDTLDYYTYHLVAGEGDNDNGSFSLIGDLLVSATTFDFETNSSYSVRIRTTDNAAFYLEKEFIILINDREEGSGTTSGSTPPDTLILDNNMILENNMFGDLVGRLHTVDKDSFDIHSYQLVSGTDDDDNSMFMVLGDMLMAAFKFDYETKAEYRIRVRSTDLGSNFLEMVFVINIVDVFEPIVGMADIEAGQVFIFPNPFSYASTIRFANPANESFMLILTDISGKVCRMEGEISTSEHVLKRGDLKPGLYFIEMRGPKTYRGKILIE